MNLGKLNGKIAEKGVKKKDIANMFGISIQALNKKLTGKSKISVDDATKFCEILEIENNAEKNQIFLQ